MVKRYKSTRVEGSMTCHDMAIYPIHTRSHTTYTGKGKKKKKKQWRGGKNLPMVLSSSSYSIRSWQRRIRRKGTSRVVDRRNVAAGKRAGGTETEKPTSILDTVDFPWRWGVCKMWKRMRMMRIKKMKKSKIWWWRWWKWKIPAPSNVSASPQAIQRYPRTI